VGTNYSGIQRDPKLLHKQPSISIILEEALRQFNKRQETFVARVRSASRTDVGVHALCNACTFDTVQDESSRREYETERIRQGLNHFMIGRNE
jgi:tRNA pseudouridine(38-40) synthase